MNVERHAVYLRALGAAAGAAGLLAITVVVATALTGSSGARAARTTAVDLAVELRGPAQVAPGAVGVAYTVRVTNRGPEAADDVVITQTVPAPFQIVGASDGGLVTAGAVRWALAALPAGLARTVTVTTSLSRTAAPGGVTLDAVARGAGDELAPEDNAAELAVTLGGADLQLALASDVGDVRPGERLTHTVTVANVSKRAAQGVVVSATLAAGTRFVSDDAAAHGFTRTVLSDTVLWRRPALPGLGTAYIVLVTGVDAAVAPGTQLVHTGVVRADTLDDVPANDAARAPPVRVVVPDPWLVATGPAEAGVGAELELTLRYGNGGTGTAPAVVVTATLPAGLAHVSAAPPAEVGAAGRLTWRVGWLPAGAVDLIRVRARVAVTVPPGARLVSQAGVVAGSVEGPRADNSGRTELGVVPGGPADVSLHAPASVPASDDAVQVVVAVHDAGGNPVADETGVHLTTSRGTLVPQDLATVGGVVTATLAPGHQVGRAVVRALAGTVVAEQGVDVLPGPPARVQMGPVEAVVTVEDAVSLTVTALDTYGNLVADGTPVTLAPDLGAVAPATGLTVAGQINAAWRSTATGSGTVTATVGAQTALARATFRPGAPAQLVVTVGAEQLPVSDGQAMVRARVLDRYSNLVTASQELRFAATGGTVQPASARTAGGVAETTFRAGAVPGVATLQASAGALVATGQVALRPADLAFVAADVVGPRGRARDTQTHPGEPLTYTLEVRNDGLARARGVVLGVSLPDQWEVAEVRVAGGGGERPDVPAGLLEPPAAGRTQRAWTLPDLAAGTEADVVLRGQVSPTASWTGQDSLYFQSAITTTTAVARPAGLRRKDTADVYTADLFVHVQLDSLASRLVPGGEAVYDVTFGNRQPLTDLGPVRITDTLPAWMTFDHWQPQPGTNLREVSPLGPALRELVWEPVPPFGIGAGFRLWLTIDQDVPPDARFENVVRIGSSVLDITPVDDSASDGGVGLRGVNLVAGLIGPDSAQPGASVDLDVVVRNTALQDVAHGVLVDAYPPAGATLVGMDPPGQTSGGRVRWQLESLPPAGEQRYTLHLRLPETAVLGSVLRSRSEVSSTDQDRYLGDNAAEHSLRVVSGPPASVVVAAGRPAVTTCSADSAGTVLTATVRDAGGRAVADGTVVAWSSDAGELSAVTSTVRAGLAAVVFRAEGAAPGLARLTARSGGAVGWLDLPLVPGAPAALTLSAEPAVVPLGGVATLTATARDACGNHVADDTPLRLAAERGSFVGGGTTASVLTKAGRAEATLDVGAVAGRLALVARYDALMTEAAVMVSADVVATATPPVGPAGRRVWLPFAVQRRGR